MRKHKEDLASVIVSYHMSKIGSVLKPASPPNKLTLAIKKELTRIAKKERKSK